MLTKAQVQAEVDIHAPNLCPNWQINVSLHEFDDFAPDDPIVPDAGRADISMAHNRNVAWLRVDPRSHAGSLMELICHELAHTLTHEYHYYTDEILAMHLSANSVPVQYASRLEERLAWAIADAYLRGRR